MSKKRFKQYHDDDHDDNEKQQHHQHRREGGGGVEEEISVRARKHPEIPTRFFFSNSLAVFFASRGVSVPLKRERNRNRKKEEEEFKKTARTSSSSI